MPPETLQLLPALIAIIFVASVVQGAIGFGFGLFAVAALSLFVQLKVSTPLLAILNVPVTVYVLWRLRHSVVWSGMAPIFIGLLVGIPFGIFVLVKWPQDLLLRILGVVLIAAAWRTIAARKRNGNAAEPCEDKPPTGFLATCNGLLVGATTGALAGAFNTGGPPVIAYVYCRPWTKEQRTATLQAVFIISMLARILVMALPPAQLYDPPLLLTALACMPGAILGMFVGHAVFRRVPHATLEVIVSGFLLLVAAKLLIAP